MKFKAGQYYIGDPAYLFNKSYDEFFSETQFLSDGKHRVFGKRIALCNATHLETDTYTDQDGNEYTIDTGILSLIPVEMLDIDKKINLEEAARIGKIVDFKDDFDVTLSPGLIEFGHIRIDTR